MIPIKSEFEIQAMRRAGKITAAALAFAGELVRPGVTTHEIDREICKFIRSHGAEPTFLNYNGFPGSACISINDTVIHGIPGPRRIVQGDIVSIDVGARIDGFTGDMARTFAAGEISEEAARLISVTEQSFWEGMKFARAGNRVPDISKAIEDYVTASGFSVVREYTGHGVGAQLHEEPEVPNFVFRNGGPRPRLYAGMTLAVEPMVNAGRAEVRRLKDGWTVVTRDGSLSAHYENTILIRDGEPEILTIV
ncbi:MAG: type I methionyl aminopeptidase [Oscillospiraceae bacterium]|nr:type I methionyl aminopeptidase [Oscillospiraceae bacterium]